MSQDLDLLIELYLDGSAHPEQIARLENLLQTDRAARATFLHSMSAVLFIRDLSEARDRSAQWSCGLKVSSGRQRSLLPLALAACITIVAMAAFLLMPAPKIAILTASGTGVEVRRGNEVSSVNRTASLLAGDSVRLGSLSDGVIEFPDFTRLELSHGSVLTLQESAHGKSGKRLYLERGTILAKVAKQPEGFPFVIETRTAIVEVVGTEFQLRAGDYSTRINVTEGAVRFQRRADRMETLVSQGQQSIATAYPDHAMFAAKIDTPSFLEKFDDEKLESRGWYDAVQPAFSDREHVKGSRRSVEFRFSTGATRPAGGAALRRRMPDSEAVCLAYWIKRRTGENVAASGSEITLMTNKDGDWIGPGCTHLTISIGVNENRPAVWIQDALNLDESRLGQNLVGITEFRAVAGGNGDSDGQGEGVTYLRENSTLHSNWKGFTAEGPLFDVSQDPLAKDGWQYVVVYVKLNSIRDGKGVPDGELRYWCNGRLALNHNKLLFRTGAHADMKLNQVLIAPSLHSPALVDQFLWLDDLTVMPGILPADWEPHFPIEE